MASVPRTEPRRRRSKGCDQCRRRRVKCDETTPICRQCLRFGYDCTGLVQGLMVVDMTADASQSSSSSNNAQSSKNKKAKARKDTAAQAKEFDVQERSYDTPLDRKPSAATLPPTVKLEVVNEDKFAHRILEEKTSNIHDEVVLITQPSNAKVVEEQLIRRFMVLSRPPEPPGAPRSWLWEIPDLKYHTKLPAFSYSLRAAAMAFHTLMDPSKTNRNVATQWYITALSHHRAFLVAKQTQKSNIIQRKEGIPTVEEMLIPVFMCIFEMLLSTTPTAILQHREAACQILEQRGPESCQRGVPYQIFITMRVSNACLSIITGKYMVFSSERWRVIPFRYQKKSWLHQIIDLMLCIPPALDVTGTMGLYQIVNKVTAMTTAHAALAHNCLLLINDLDEWWRRFETQRPNQYNRFPSPESDDLTSQDKAQTSSSPSHSTTARDLPIQLRPAMFIYRDPMVAHTVLLYNCCNVILHAVLDLLYTQHAFSLLHDRSAGYHGGLVVSHSSSLMMLAEYQKQTRQTGTDFMTLIWAIKVSACLSPNAEQSAKASNMVRDWSMTMGMKSIALAKDKA